MLNPLKLSLVTMAQSQDVEREHRRGRRRNVCSVYASVIHAETGPVGYYTVDLTARQRRPRVASCSCDRAGGAKCETSEAQSHTETSEPDAAVEIAALACACR